MGDIERIFHLKLNIHVLVLRRSVNITCFTYNSGKAYSNLCTFFVCNFGNNVDSGLFEYYSFNKFILKENNYSFDKI